MPQFITRVELHGASSGDYMTLHAAMSAANFHRVINDDQGNKFHLPTAEYHSHGPALTVLDVRRLASEAARSTGLQYWVLVMEYTKAAWELPVEKPRNLQNLLVGHLSRNVP